MDTVRDFVSRRQTSAYERLSKLLGFGRDAARAHAAIANPPVPGVVASMPDDVKQQFTEAGPADWREFEARSASIHQEYWSRPLPTPYEDARWYPMLAMVFDDLQSRLEQDGRPVRPAPVFATLPSGEPNARTVQEPRTDTPVIFFEQGLFRFLYDFSMIAAWSMPALTVDELRSDTALAMIHSGRMEPIPEVAQFFSDAIYEYVVFGNPQYKSAGVPRPPHNRLAAAVLSSLSERFVVAHELAHIILGHLGRAESWQQEYAADTEAQTIVAQYSRDSLGSVAMGLWAADIALTAVNYLELALSVMTFGAQPSWISATHPDPFSRRRHLRTLVEPFAEPAPEIYGAFTRLTVLSDALFSRLWEHAADRLGAGYGSGARPFPTWTTHINESFALRT